MDAQAGRVLVDGNDVRDVRLASLRNIVAMVFQESFLFPISMAENIAFGRSGASRAEIEAAARDAGAHDFIVKMPEGYDTIIGDAEQRCLEASVNASRLHAHFCGMRRYSFLMNQRVRGQRDRATDSRCAAPIGRGTNHIHYRPPTVNCSPGGSNPGAARG
jgi:ABC-type sugar transport system ATPase subunit